MADRTLSVGGREGCKNETGLLDYEQMERHFILCNQREGGREDVPKEICNEALANLFCPEAQGDQLGGISEVGGKTVCWIQGWTCSWSNMMMICSSCDGRRRGSLHDPHKGWPRCPAAVLGLPKIFCRGIPHDGVIHSQSARLRWYRSGAGGILDLIQSGVGLGGTLEGQGCLGVEARVEEQCRGPTLVSGLVGKIL